MHILRNLCKTYVLCTCVLTSVVSAQRTKSSLEIYDDIQRLNFLGNAMYVAAHPDDENTKMISYLSNKIHAKVTYLSLTRGDGGQNLIGSELKESLGLIRSNELIEARKIDGGQQRFTTAIDFGYSKHPDETFEFWDKPYMLKQVVGQIRKLRPDIIINRFDHRTAGTTHGHHTAASILSYKAFDLASDSIYKDQFNGAPWRPNRLYFNTNWWFYGSREAFDKIDKSNLVEVAVGEFDPTRGQSYNEIASLSRSQHKSQGFGTALQKNQETEYLEILKGTKSESKNLFDGIDTSWNRIKEGQAIGQILNAVEDSFDFKNPSNHLTELIKAQKLIKDIEDVFWRNLKLDAINSIILDVARVDLEAHVAQKSVQPGEKIEVDLDIVNRGSSSIKLQSIAISNSNIFSSDLDTIVTSNAETTFTFSPEVLRNSPYSSPYWLQQKHNRKQYTVTSNSDIGKPASDTSMAVSLSVIIRDATLMIELPVRYKEIKPEYGEYYEQFHILPSAALQIDKSIEIFDSKQSKNVRVEVLLNKEKYDGILTISAPEGWSVSPKQLSINWTKNQGTFPVDILVTPPANQQSKAFLSFELTSSFESHKLQQQYISYAHIDKQTLLSPAEIELSRIIMQKSNEKVGYIMGAGDKVFENLLNLGYDIELIPASSLTTQNLKRFKTIITGIRAYNVSIDLKANQELLFDFVRQGGNLILQYNTANRWGAQFKKLAPYPMKLSYSRVTDEYAPVKILNSKHRAMNYPNKITVKDFDGWVQERGLYFPETWSNNFTALLEFQDKGEAPLKGSLLIAPLGKGNYIYTSLSLFRQLPEGVAGAYRLLSNLIELNSK
ncbi:MAG: LmbE family protein [Flavobacteriaceae bacterium]|nr:LmbE family protein [Flavobacteriaceae bacterium]